MATAGISRVCRAILLTITIFSLSFPACAQYSGGTGEPNDPYQIATAEDLIALGETPEDYDKHFILTADIDLDPNLPGRKVFDKAVIGLYYDPFTGVFDGNEHTISNLTIDGTNHLGLFGFLRLKAEIKRLGTLNVNVSGSGSCVGGLVGQNGYSGESGSTITDCYSRGKVSGKAVVGGLVGGNYSGSVTQCYSIGTVTGNSDDVGGLLGSNHGSVNMSYSTGTVNGIGQNSHVGGLVGSNFRGLVTQCYSTSMVSGTGWYSDIGGLVGWNYDSIVIDCYSTGSVSGNTYVGGLVGYNNGHIIQSYSKGKVSGEAAVVGGLVGGTGDYSGMRDITGVVIECLWDVQTSGQTASKGGTGKTTAEMQDIQTYLDEGWDFVGEIDNGTHELWQIPSEGGYPVLTAFGGYTPAKLKGMGTMDDPYLISDAIELGAMIHYSPYAHYRLVASIDLSGICWGTAVIPRFAGRFDGNNLTISYLTIKGGVYLGLFGRLDSGAKIVNLGVVDVNITGSGNNIGGLVGQIYGESSGIIKSYSTGTVRGGSYVGGLVGSSESTLTECYTTGTVSSSYVVSYTGGLVGRNLGTVISCYSTDWVTGLDYLGGLVGGNDGTVTTCYSTGTVSGYWHVGGIVGINQGYIEACYSTGIVTGNQQVGGLVGSNAGRGTEGVVNQSFWDTETSSRATSAGGKGLTTAEMQMTSTFLDAGWDFVDETENGTEDIWWIIEGQDYPRLWWELVPDEPLQNVGE